MCVLKSCAVLLMHEKILQLVIGDDRGYITVCNSANGAFVKVCVSVWLLIVHTERYIIRYYTALVEVTSQKNVAE
jgi:hypothetical protein